MDLNTRNSSMLTGLGMSLAIAVGCSTPESHPKPVQQKHGTPEKSAFDRRIEAEINKHHHAVVALIRGVKFKKRTQDDINNDIKNGFSVPHGSFSAIENVIVLNDGDREEEVDESIESVDHEIAHAIYSVLYGGEEGLKAPDGYVFSGPTLEESNEYCTVLVKDPRFEHIRATLETAKKMSVFSERLNAYCKSHEERTDEIDKIVHDKEFQNKLKRAKGVMTPDEYDRLISDLEAFKKMYAAYREEMEGQMALLSGMIKEKKTNKNPQFFEVAGSTMDEMEKIVKKCGLSEDASLLTQRINDAIFAAREKKYHEKIRLHDEKILELEAKIEKETDPFEASVLKSELSHERRMKISNENSHASEIRMRESDQSMAEILKKMKAARVKMNQELGDMNRQKIDDILGDPNEVFARLVDSLMSVYFGPTEQNSFPLTEADLKFLLQFKANGESIYEDAVEKYRIGMQLIAQGKSPEEVRRLLEHAKTLQHDGKVWVWDRSSFTFRGGIPRYQE